MPPDLLHKHPEFASLIQIVADKHGINPVLVEKDYWIMHCLYGLQQLGHRFELKGGTSLSKGHRIIDRFSEDIDIRIEPEEGIIDNRAHDVACYHPGYTLVEKLQAISTKFRKQQEADEFPPNFMRHYYDVYRLLQDEGVQAFTGTAEYHDHKAKRFPKADNPIIADNPAFTLEKGSDRADFQAVYEKSADLYYRGQPPFEDILAQIGQWAPRL